MNTPLIVGDVYLINYEDKDEARSYKGPARLLEINAEDGPLHFFELLDDNVEGAKALFACEDIVEKVSECS